MTDWRNMEAGLELDVQIARLLGLNVHTADEAPADDLYGGKQFCIDREWHTAWFIDAEGQYCPIPVYSTDLNAAWQLVVPDEPFELVNGGACGREAKWTAVFYWQHVGQADNAALAICRAWLAWKEMQS